MKLTDYKNIKKEDEIIVSCEDADNVLISIFFKGGNSLDKHNLGIAHLVEHSIFLNKDSVGLFDLGFDVNFNATTDTHCINLAFSFEVDYDKPMKAELARFGVALDYLSELIMRENFNYSDLENEKNVIYNESIKGASNDLQNAYSTFVWDVEQKHIDGISNNVSLSFGSKQILDHIGIEEIHNFKEKYFTQDNLVIMVKGPFKERVVKKVIRKNFIDKFKTNKETVFDFGKCAIIDENKYYISKQESKHANITAYLTFNNSVKIDDACLVADLMNAYSNDASLNKLTRKIDMSFREKGLVYQINFAQPLILGDNIGFHFNFDTNKENVKKALIHSAKYIRECLEKIKYEDELIEYLEYLKEQSSIEIIKNKVGNVCETENCEEDDDCYTFNEGYDLDKEWLNFLENFEEMFVYSVLPKDEMFDNIVYAYKNYSPASIAKIVDNVRHNSNLKFIVAGDIELSELPDIELLNDIAIGKFEKAIDYYGNMQRNVNWKKKVECLNGAQTSVLETRALVCVDNKDNKEKEDLCKLNFNI